MPSSSSSVEPDHGAALPRQGDTEGVVSFLRTQHDVDAVCGKYGVPKDRYPARPAGDLRASSPPPAGCVCVYADALEAGMRVPLHGFFCDVLAHFGIAPTQLAPNGWRIMAGFLVLCHSAAVPPSLPVFRYFFLLCVLSHKHKGKGCYFFRSRDTSGLRFKGMPSCIKDWKNSFFFLSSPEPWPFPVEWGEPSKRSFMEPVLNSEGKKHAAKLLRTYAGAAVDIDTCLSDSNLAAAMASAASPPPPPPPPPSSFTRISTDSKGMDPSVYKMMKNMLAEKAANQASAPAKKLKAEPGSHAPGPSPLCAKKRNLEEVTSEEGPPRSLLNKPLSGMSSPPPGFPISHDGDGTDWEAARELLQGAVAPPQHRVFAASEPSDVVASSYVAILQAANYVSSSLGYALELEEKLAARDAEVAALEKQLSELKSELAAARAERDGARGARAAARGARAGALEER